MVQELRQHLPASIVIFLILLIGSIYLVGDTMHTYPAYVHAWTQTDRLALAMNFQENGFDFFHPATYSLLTKDGITQVDFPIHDYLIACISSFLKTDLVVVFRAYNLVYSLLGLFFFFRIALLVLGSSVRSIFATSFLFTLPFFVYYQNGFLPSVPSFANFLIGLYFIIKSNQQSFKLLSWGTFFLLLAALARAPFFIFLFAFFLYQIIRQWQQKNMQFKRIILPLFAILLFIVYWLYNQSLATAYGSMFLSEPMYFKRFSQFFEIVNTAMNRWGNEIMSPFHALLLLALLFFSARKLLQKGIAKTSIAFLMQYTLIATIGVILFFFAFGLQFADHDYYYIDTLLPILSLFLLLLLFYLEIPHKWYTPVATICGIFFFYFFSHAKMIQEKRYTPAYDDRIEYAYKVYEDAKDDLIKWGVQPEDTLYVIEANTTNMPFTIWKNKGYTNLNSSSKILSKELDRNFTYALLIDSFFVSSTFKDYPEIIQRLEKIDGNGKISLYRKSKLPRPENFFDHFIFYGYSNFDDSSNMSEEAIAWTDKKNVDSEMQQSLHIQPINEFTLSFKCPLSDIDPDLPIRVLFTADFMQKDTAKIRVVTAVNDYYNSNYLENQLKELNKWEKIQYGYKIPPRTFKKGDELGFYFWNPEKHEVFVDNVQLLMYQ